LTNVRDVREVDSNWWGMLSEASSLVATPMSTANRALPSDGENETAGGQGADEHLDQSQMNEGYFARFFEEVQLLGELRPLVSQTAQILMPDILQAREVRAPSTSSGMS
jgi:hypothetical protein